MNEWMNNMVKRFQFLPVTLQTAPYFFILSYSFTADWIGEASSVLSLQPSVWTGSGPGLDRVWTSWGTPSCTWRHHTGILAGFLAANELIWKQFGWKSSFHSAHRETGEISRTDTEPTEPTEPAQWREKLLFLTFPFAAQQENQVRRLDEGVSSLLLTCF